MSNDASHYNPIASDSNNLEKYQKASRESTTIGVCLQFLAISKRTFTFPFFELLESVPFALGVP